MRITWTVTLTCLILMVGSVAAGPADNLARHLELLNIAPSITPEPDAFDSAMASQLIDSNTTLKICRVEEYPGGGTMYIAIDRKAGESERHIIIVDKKTLTALLYNGDGVLHGGLDFDYDSSAPGIVLRYLTSDAVISCTTRDDEDDIFEFSLVTRKTEETLRFDNHGRADTAAVLLDQLEAGMIEESGIAPAWRDEVEKVRTLRSWIRTVGLASLQETGMGMFREMTYGMTAPSENATDQSDNRAMQTLARIDGLFGMTPVM